MKKITFVLSAVGLATVMLFNACEKDPAENDCATRQVAERQAPPNVFELSIAHISISPEGNKVMFCQNAEPFTIPDADMLLTLQQAQKQHMKVKVSYNAWTGTLLSAQMLAVQQSNVSKTNGIAVNLEGAADDDLNNATRLGIINTTSPGLTNVVPDFATAQLMFSYIAKQCCAIPGPYSIDYCIPFQYAYDGCYARAHKMCWIINNKYHYDTHKIFSFANAGSDVLSVQGQKWGGCCINWWYHVAPLVNVNTPGGVKSYVFDPAMFDQPVLLSVWLHAQENPVCAGGANVTMINIQPTTSFWPSDYSGYAFDPDPTYSYTNYYLNYYGPMSTCP